MKWANKKGSLYHLYDNWPHVLEKQPKIYQYNRKESKMYERGKKRAQSDELALYCFWKIGLEVALSPSLSSRLASKTATLEKGIN